MTDQLGFNMASLEEPHGRCSHGRSSSEFCPFCNPVSTANTRAAAERQIKPSAAGLREQVYPMPTG